MVKKKEDLTKIFDELKGTEPKDKLKITIDSTDSDLIFKKLLKLFPNIVDKNPIKSGRFLSKDIAKKLKVLNTVPLLSELLVPGGTIFVYLLNDKLMVFNNGIVTELPTNNAINLFYKKVKDVDKIPEYVIFIGIFGEVIDNNDILRFKNKYNNFLNLTTAGKKYFNNITIDEYKKDIKSMWDNMEEPGRIKILKRKINEYE